MSPTTTAGHLTLDSPEYQAFVRFVQLTIRKRQLEAEAKTLAEELKALDPQLLSYLGSGAYEMVTVEGYTLSPHREPWVYPAEGYGREEVCRALVESGLPHYVTENYSTKSITSYVKQLEEANQERLASGEISSSLELLPPPLARVLRVSPTYRVQMTRHWKK